MRRPLVFITHDLGGVIVKKVRHLQATLLPSNLHKADAALILRVGIMDRNVREQQVQRHQRFGLESGASLLRDCRKAGSTLTNMVQIFFGCPHRCRSVQDLEDSIARLLLASEIACPYGIANTIRHLGNSIIEINDSFLAFKIPLITSILSVYSNEQKYSSGVSCHLVSEELLSKCCCEFTLID